MKRFSLVATLALSAALIGSLALGALTPAVAQEKAPQPSKAAAKLLKAAEDAIRAKKYDVVAARLKDVQALPERSPYDDYLVHEMQAFLEFHSKSYPALEKDLEATLASGFLKPAEVPAHVRQLAALNLTLKDYNKAIDFGTRAIKGGFADDGTYEVVEQAYNLKGDKKGTLHFVSDYVEAEIKAGKTPKERWLQALVSSCIALKDEECETHAFERLVTYYPKSDYWQNLLNSLFQSQDYAPDEARLQLYRLALEVNVLKNADDFTEMAQLDLDQGAAGEAVRVLEKGFEAKVFVEKRQQDKNNRLLVDAQKRAAAGQTELPKMQAAAAADATGQKSAQLGIALFGYQQYPQAIEALQAAIKKDGLHNVLDTRLLLGIAELKAGKKDDALKDFHLIKGSPALDRLANLWALHARQA